MDAAERRTGHGQRLEGPWARGAGGRAFTKVAPVTTAAASDPFESTANAARYVPRAACERVLEAVELALARGAGPVAITGPAGLGKSMLLSVLAERLRGRYHVVRLPYPALSAAELCRWVLEDLGEPAGGDDDPAGALLDRAFRASATGREILLLLDDASSLPPRTARDLATLVSASGGAVRAVLAAVDDARLGAALAALGAAVGEVRFDEPMSADETTAYVRARIAAAGARGARFDGETLARLYGATGGVPRRVHELGSALWRSPDGEDRPALIARWMRGDQGREAEPTADPIETDETVAALELGGENVGEQEPGAAHALEPPESAERETGEAALGAVGEAEAGPPPDAPRDGRRGAGGRWVALLALALLVVTLPYALTHMERWLEAGLPDPPAADGVRLDAPPAEAAAGFEEGEPAADPDAATGLEPDVDKGLHPPVFGPESPADAPTPVAAAEPTPLTDEPATGTGAPMTGTGGPMRATDDAPDTAAKDAPDTAAKDAPDTAAKDAPDTAAKDAPGTNSKDAPGTTTAKEAPDIDTADGPDIATDDASDAAVAMSESAPTPAPGLPPAETTAEPGAAAVREPAVAPSPLERRRPRGIAVSVEAGEPAVIHVDGGRVGTTPLAALDLSPGLHVFRAEFASGRAVVRAVEISAQNRRVFFEASPGVVEPIPGVEPAPPVGNAAGVVPAPAAP